MKLSSMPFSLVSLHILSYIIVWALFENDHTAIHTYAHIHALNKTHLSYIFERYIKCAFYIKNSSRIVYTESHSKLLV